MRQGRWILPGLALWLCAGTTWAMEAKPVRVTASWHE